MINCDFSNNGDLKLIGFGNKLGPEDLEINAIYFLVKKINEKFWFELGLNN